MQYTHVATEGIVDTAVVRRILAETGVEIAAVYGESGKHHLDKKLGGYNEAARHGRRWFVLRDLNGDAECAPTLVPRLLPTPAPDMTFRVAMREIESWLLADATAFARFFRVSASRIPIDPDSVRHPKQCLVGIVRSSTSRATRAAIVPLDDRGSRVGPGYSSRIIEFVQRHWRPSEASRRSDSLRRCLARLETLAT
ncbi:MAG: hypothetical protein F4137_00560 [Acidobacteria bacterium]|nr:hypothetical protein [Acidobacteriota bacterium]MYH27363.1 hypothetical protein [Acidobacteriota bacterium]